jgi:hypothetical protein
MRRPLVMTLQLLHSEFPYIYEGNFLFFFISAKTVKIALSSLMFTTREAKREIGRSLASKLRQKA